MGMFPRRRPRSVMPAPRSTIDGVQDNVLFVETINQAQQDFLNPQVDPLRTMTRYLGSRAFPGNIGEPWQAPQIAHVNLYLSSPQTVRGTIERGPGSPSAVWISWEVISFNG